MVFRQRSQLEPNTQEAAYVSVKVLLMDHRACAHFLAVGALKHDVSAGQSR